jgi:membrane-associated protein
VILARFMPIIRTFAPILAGVGRMDYKVFLLYNLIGGALWALGLTALGYFLGSTIPGVDKYLFPIVLLIIIVSMLPGIIASLRSLLAKRKQKS